MPSTDLPDIIFLHGIMGAHLDAPQRRVWLDVKELAGGYVAEWLTLAADGLTDATSGQYVRPGPHLESKYEDAARAWREAGFVVHAFSYDWRKGVALCADMLHFFVESLALQRPGRPFVLVAHSMGGLVASVYGARHPEWRQRIQQAVFLGSPLGGSYAPVEAVLGTYPFFQKLALVSVHNDIEDLRRTSRTLPGLMDMLPDPRLFPDMEPLYDARNWPGGIVPEQQWLTQSLALKRTIAESPLLEKTKLLVATGHPTVCRLVLKKGVLAPGPRAERGDGTVPARAAVLPGLSAWRAQNEHTDLAKDPLCIQAVIELLRDGAIHLPQVTAEELQGPVPEKQGVVGNVVAAGQTRIREIRHRFEERRELHTADLDWLLSSEEPSVKGPETETQAG
jgi:pimeloyl-ACP methyl ester carboxylesterase